jgi:hypothetical protein
VVVSIEDVGSGEKRKRWVDSSSYGEVWVWAIRGRDAEEA